MTKITLLIVSLFVSNCLIISPAQAEIIIPPDILEPHEPPPAPEREWTIMVYMNGKNNLSNYVLKELDEMEEYGTPDNVYMLVQAGRALRTPGAFPGNNPTPHPGWNDPPYLGAEISKYESPNRPGKGASTWTGVRRYLVNSTTDLGKSVIFKGSLSDVDMGSYKQLSAFGQWVKKNYPSKHYMLIVWSHGNGWKLRPEQTDKPKSISRDDETNSEITADELGLALQEIGGVDIYASDACLMQMAEVAYAVKDSAKIVIGSEESEPGNGWAYNIFLKKIHELKDTLTPETVARAATEAYDEAYAVINTSTTLSAIRVDGMNNFAALLDTWTIEAEKESKEILAAARAQTATFNGADSKDLLGFIGNVDLLSTSEPLKATGKNLTDYFYNEMLISNYARGTHTGKAHGLGIYLPLTGYNTEYQRLNWAKSGRWPEFIKNLNLN